MDWFSLVVLGALVLLIPTAYAGFIGAPFVPTRRQVLKKAFKDINVNEKDVLVDLGCGSGTVIKEAQNKGAKAVGYELSPIMWAISYLRFLANPRVSVRYGNFYRRQLPSDTTIVFAFLMPKIMPRLEKYLWEQNLPNLKYILTYTFQLPDRPPRHIIHQPGFGTIYVYKPLN